MRFRLQGRHRSRQYSDRSFPATLWRICSSAGRDRLRQTGPPARRNGPRNPLRVPATVYDHSAPPQSTADTVFGSSLPADLYALTPLGNVISTQDPGAMRSRDQDPLWQEGSVRSSADELSDKVRVRVGVLASTVDLRCPRCGLAMFARSQWIAAKHRPRCIARAHKLVALLTHSEDSDRLTLGVASDRAQCTGGTR
jgi:hypothetical protein